MTAEKFQSQVGEWLAGALSEAENREMEAFVASAACDAACQQAMADAADGLALLTQALPAVSPSPRVWARISKSIAKPPARTAPWGWMAALAASVLLVVSEVRHRAQVQEMAVAQETLTRSVAQDKAACALLLQRTEAAENEVAKQREALEILHHSATQLVRLDAKNAAAPEHVRAIFNPVAKRAWIVAPALQAPPDKDYELWVVHGKQALPAGLLRGDANGVLIANVDAALLQTTPDAFVVTLEPKGGVQSSVGETLLVGAPNKG